ncbi:YlmH family RNA-binding protein [Jeotgalibacillus aurantiacus]|uniref:YlmH family RNA-binding protein n=1 Tax=Jeotgalibacillus aurantiacus TaxID=2763266 RepID=UPI001D0BCCAC|nr:RNA-binding protein [Jeotgalibacillus aurantiacus]
MSVYQHFRKEEKDFIDQVLDWKADTEMKYAPKLTDFLDPRQQFIVQSLAGQQGEVQVAFEGGGDSERKRALFYPSYFEPQFEDFELSLLQVRYPEKFVTVEHSDVLGSLMGLGIKREKLGDIIFPEHGVQIVTTKEMSSFLSMNVTQIGKATVKTEAISWDEKGTPLEKWVEKQAFVSSMRLDTITASALSISRQKAQQLIQSGRVKVNFRVEERIAFECDQGDMVSVRKFGRFRIGEHLGTTKKDRIRTSFFYLE